MSETALSEVPELIGFTDDSEIPEVCGLADVLEVLHVPAVSEEVDILRVSLILRVSEASELPGVPEIRVRETSGVSNGLDTSIVTGRPEAAKVLRQAVCIDIPGIPSVIAIVGVERLDVPGISGV